MMPGLFSPPGVKENCYGGIEGRKTHTENIRKNKNKAKQQRSSIKNLAEGKGQNEIKLTLPLHNPSLVRPDPPWPLRIRPPPYPLQHTYTKEIASFCRPL